MDTNCRYTAPAQRQQVVLPAPHGLRLRGHREDGVLRHELGESSEVPPIPLILIRVPARSVPYRRLAGDGRCDHLALSKRARSVL